MSLRASRLAAAVAAALLVLGAATAHADARDAYKKGLDAVEQKRWDEAVRQLRLAIAERPEATGLLSVGSLFRRYTPHYWLGVALAEQGDCKAAVVTFDVAAKQGKLSKEEERDLATRRQGCQKRIQSTEEAVAAAQREVDAAAAAAFQVAGVEGSPVMRSVWREGSPSFAARQEPAAAQLANARALLARAGQELDAEKATSAGRIAVQARRDLEALLADATTRRDALHAEAQRELAALGKAADEARKTVTFVTRSLTPLPPAIAKQCDRVEEALTRAAAADLGSPLADVRRMQQAIRDSLRDLRAAVKPPPDDLQRAAAAYLAGDFDGALAALDAVRGNDPRVAAHACLLRAAALHGRQALQPDDPAGTQPARDELRRCATLPLAVKPVSSAFPPSFVALYDEVAVEARPPG
jgi:tetratricopeptide (TPR) repeat protein